jgi:hypothetical protein
VVTESRAMEVLYAWTHSMPYDLTTFSVSMCNATTGGNLQVGCHAATRTHPVTQCTASIARVAWGLHHHLAFLAVLCCAVFVRSPTSRGWWRSRGWQRVIAC